MVLDAPVPQMVEQLLEVPKIIPQDRISQRTVKEEKLLSVVYKNAVESRRAARRVITCVEQKEKFKGKEQLTSYSREYVAKVEGELQKIRDGILALMDKKLVPSASTDETKVSYYKMKGDYYRYLAEFVTGDEKGKAAEGACDACVKANKIAENDLAVTHPIRLAMALNSSVFQSEVFENTDEACEMTRVAFEDAIKDPDTEVGVNATITDVITRLQAESSLQMQFPNNVDEMSINMVHTLQKTTEVPQIQVVEKTVEGPQLQIVEQIVETPETQTIQGARTSERSGTAPVRQVAQAGVAEVHLTGVMKPDDPDAKIKILAEEALHGVGGFVFDAHGNRVANDLGRRNCVTGEMWKNKPPFSLDDIAWQCKHYIGRGVRKLHESGTALAEDMEAHVSKMPDSIETHCQASLKTTKDPNRGPYTAFASGKSWDEASGKTGSEKKFYHNVSAGGDFAAQPYFVAEYVGPTPEVAKRHDAHVVECVTPVTTRTVAH